MLFCQFNLQTWIQRLQFHFTPQFKCIIDIHSLLLSQRFAMSGSRPTLVPLHIHLTNHPWFVCLLPSKSIVCNVIVASNGKQNGGWRISRRFHDGCAAGLHLGHQQHQPQHHLTIAADLHLDQNQRGRRHHWTWLVSSMSFCWTRRNSIDNRCTAILACKKLQPSVSF